MGSRLPLLLAALLLVAAAAGAEPRVVVDAAGRRLEVKAPFQRVVSLYSAHTENLFALGLDGQVVGVSQSETYPPQALARPQVSHRADVERVLALEPDLVLIRPLIDQGYATFVGRLEAAGVAVVSLQPRSADELPEYWRALGRLTGREREAEALTAAFQAGVAELRARLAGRPPVGVYFEAMHGKMKTVAPDSIAAWVVAQAGGVNVAADARPSQGSNIADYGKEAILARGPEIEVFLAQQGPMNDVTVAQLLAEPGFRGVKAVREGRVYLVDEELVSRPTPRLLQGIRQVAARLHPEAFKETKP
ncbi:MAG: ABC transporter substrate-binding protein [Deferrisomatales bacterium]